MITFWLDFKLAFRNLARQRRRSAIAIGSVAFGITALILATGFISWIFEDFRDSTIRSHLGHLQIVRPGYHDAG
ncbi:MAG TPA: ABC transporter permease, partial [Nitrosospira sp.]|nr:ABC transporter permease [Nitrosospira sp.]